MYRLFLQVKTSLTLRLNYSPLSNIRQKTVKLLSCVNELE